MELALRISEANESRPEDLVDLKFQIDDHEVQDFIRNAIMTVGSPGSEKLMRAVSYKMKQQSLDRFQEQGTPSEGHWAPLAESTLLREGRIKWKPDAEGTGEIGEWRTLEDTGLLKRSIENLADDISATVGTPVYYGVYHESDEPRTSNLPRRAFLGGDDPQDQEQIMVIVGDFLARIR